MNLEQKMIQKLMAYNVDSQLASQLVGLGYGISKLRNTSIRELEQHLGDKDLARKVKQSIKRPPIPDDVIIRLIEECDWSCCICWDVKPQPVIVHHIGPFANTQDHSYENLVVLCPTHHADAHSKSDLTGALLPASKQRTRKMQFIEAIKEWKKGKRLPPGKEDSTERSSKDQIVKEYEIIFDESHGQGDWIPVKPTIDEEFYTLSELARKKFDVGYLPDGSNLDERDLSNARLFILTIGPGGRTFLSPKEMRILHEFVRKPGRCLLVISTYDGDAHHKANLNDLLDNKYGIQFKYDVILPKDSTKDEAYVHAGYYDPDSRFAINAYSTYVKHPKGITDCSNKLLKDVKELRALSSCSLYISNDEIAFPLVTSDPMCKVFEQKSPSWGRRSLYKDPYQQASIIMAASKKGKVIALGGWKMFTNRFLEEHKYQNKQLFINILDWVTSICTG